MLKVILHGALAGLGLAAMVAVGESVVFRGYLFGLQTVIIGGLAGGIMLVIALLMSLVSYSLATRGKAVLLQRRLLLAAVWTGTAGMSCGLSAVTVWAVAGSPVFP